MAWSRSLSLVGVLVLPLGLAAPADGGREDDARDRTFLHSPGYPLRHRAHGLRLRADFHGRPRQSGLSYSRETPSPLRGRLSLYPGPPDAPHRGRLFNDYARSPHDARSRRSGTPRGGEAPRGAPPAEDTGEAYDGPSGAPARGRPWRGGPPVIIIDPEPARDRTLELPMANAAREDGWSLLARGETVRALGSFAGRVAVSGSDAEARAGYALAAAQVGDDDVARAAMRLALEIQPDVLERVPVDATLARRLRDLRERYADEATELAEMAETAESESWTSDDDAEIVAAALDTLLAEAPVSPAITTLPNQLAAILRSTVCRIPPLR